MGGRIRPLVVQVGGLLKKWYLIDTPDGVVWWDEPGKSDELLVWLSVLEEFLPVVVPSSCVSLGWLLEEFLHFLHGQFTLGNLVYYFLLASSGSHTSCVWLLPVENRKLNSSSDSVATRATLGSTMNTCSASVRDASGRISHICTLTWTRILRWCFFVLSQNGEMCSVAASGALRSGILGTSCRGWQGA